MNNDLKFVQLLIDLVSWCWIFAHFLNFFDFQKFNVRFWNYYFYMMFKFEFWKELAIPLISSFEKSILTEKFFERGCYQLLHKEKDKNIYKFVIEAHDGQKMFSYLVWITRSPRKLLKFFRNISKMKTNEDQRKDWDERKIRESLSLFRWSCGLTWLMSRRQDSSNLKVSNEMFW
jgi:hypothetical protein